MSFSKHFREFPAIRQHRYRPVPDHPHFRIPRKHRRHPAELLAHPPVIAVQKSHHFPAAFRYPNIKCRSLPAILFVKIAYSRLELPHDLARAIRGSVVHHDDFPVALRKILLQHTDNRLLNKFFVIVRVDQDARVRLSQVTSPACPCILAGIGAVRTRRNPSARRNGRVAFSSAYHPGTTFGRNSRHDGAHSRRQFAHSPFSVSTCEASSMVYRCLRPPASAKFRWACSSVRTPVAPFE